MIFLFIFFNSQTVLAQWIPEINPDQLQTTIEVQSLTTDANYDSEGGSFEKLEGGQEYSSFSGGARTMFSPSKNWGFLGGFSFSSATSISLEDERTNTEFTELFAGAYYQLNSKPFEFIPSVNLVIPFNRVDPETDDVLTGEGAMQLITGFWLVKEWGPSLNFFNAAYNYLDEDRGHRLQWQVGSEFILGLFYLGGKVWGFSNIAEDAFTDAPEERGVVTNRVNGSSLKYFSVNPEQMGFNVWTGLSITKYQRGILGFGQTIDGKNSSADNYFFLNYEMSLNVSPSSKRKKSPFSKNKKELKEFVIEDEQYNQKLFNEETHRQRRKRRIRDTQMLDDTEDFLENQ